jgi:single-stranded-DNA-specific exonuclease
VTAPRIERRVAPAAALAALRAAGVEPLLARIYAARGVSEAGALERGLDGLPDPEGLPGLDAAAARLLAARDRGERVCIVGDYDADGATGTALAVRGLRALGFPQVAFRVPDRFVHGYGLSPGIVEDLLDADPPDLIVTVDNGIASVEGVAAARAAGVDVVVTDHHLPGAVLPAAAAITNPRLDPASPFLELAGVGVVFFLLVALRRRLRARGEAEGVNLAAWLDLVALGTVADVVPLGRPNRVLVEQGLRRMRAGRSCMGIRALADVAGRDRAHLRASDLAFALAPRLNAAGRLEDMTLGVELLLTDDPLRARDLAARLDAINRERREIEADMSAVAASLAAELPDDWGLCLHDPAWHAGVVGIVAGRVKERLHRPVVAFAEAEPGVLRGSARSVPGLHVRDAIETVATRHPTLVRAFGGHAMAAGLTLATADLARFARAFDAVVREQLTEADLARVQLSDGELTAAELDLTTARRLETAGPWGAAFPEPVFDGEFEVEDVRVIGEAHVRLRLAKGSRRGIGAIAFGGVEQGWDAPPSRVRLLYRLEVNRWRGSEQLQLGVVHLEGA